MTSYKVTYFNGNMLRSRVIEAGDVQQLIYTLSSYGISLWEILRIELVENVDE